MEVNQKEQNLLLLIRNRFRFGKIVVLTRDGLPYKIEETVKYADLDQSTSLSPEDI